MLRKFYESAMAEKLGLLRIETARSRPVHRASRLCQPKATAVLGNLRHNPVNDCTRSEETQ